MLLFHNLTIEDPNIKTATIGGITYVARRAKGASKFKCRACLAHNGAALDPEGKQGLAHKFEHMGLRQGSQHFKTGDVALYALKQGGDINATTSQTWIAFHGNSLNAHAENILFAISDIACRPLYSEKQFLFERERILREWARGKMHPYSGPANQRFLEEILPLFQRNGRALAAVIGDETSIRNISYDDSLRFFKERFVAESMIVVMEGDLDPEHMIAMAAKHFSLPRATQPIEEPSPFSFAPTTRYAQPHAHPSRASLVMQLPSANFADPRSQALELASLVLHGPESAIDHYTQRVRPLVYSIDTGGDFVTDIGNVKLVELCLSTLPEDVAPTLNGIISGFEDFLLRPNISEVEQIRSHTVFSAEQHILRNPEAGVERMLNQALLSGRILSPQALLDAFKATTLEGAQIEVARLIGRTPAVIYGGTPFRDFPSHLELAERLSELSGRVQPDRRISTGVRTDGRPNPILQAE